MFDMLLGVSSLILHIHSLFDLFQHGRNLCSMPTTTQAAAAKIAKAINRPGGKVIHFAKAGEANA